MPSSMLCSARLFSVAVGCTFPTAGGVAVVLVGVSAPSSRPRSHYSPARYSFHFGICGKNLLFQSILPMQRMRKNVLRRK